MGDHTKIEWTDATWNPITGCTLVSEGCRHCYAATLAATRLKDHPSRAGLARLNAAGEAKFTGEVRFNDGWLDQPLRWKRPRMVFVCAHGDLFHEAVPDEWIDKVFAVMALSHRHTFQVLTKRPARMREYLTKYRRTYNYGVGGFERLRAHLVDVAIALGYGDRWRELSPDWPLPNVWLGVSVEDQATADARVPILLDTPAAIRWVSYEPALGPVGFSGWLGRVHHHPNNDLSSPGTRAALDSLIAAARAELKRRGAAGLDWIVAGGESGPRARPAHPDWFRKTRDDCAAAGVPFLFKQLGAWSVVYDRDVEDPDWRRCGDIKRETPEGRWLNLAGGQGFHGERVLRVVPTTKKAAGRTLDGVIHDAWPTARRVHHPVAPAEAGAHAREVPFDG